MSSLKTLSIIVLSMVVGLGLGLGFNPSTEADAQSADVETEAYMVVMGTIYDREAFFTQYVPALPPLYERHGGSYLAVTSSLETLEGELGFESIVMSVWPDKESARAFWNDPDYRALADARIDGNWGTFDVVLVEGLPSPAQSE